MIQKGDTVRIKREDRTAKGQVTRVVGEYVVVRISDKEPLYMRHIDMVTKIEKERVG
jgi:hypothetical protein